MTAPYLKRNDLGRGISEIEFFHPAHNSLPSGILEEMAHQIEACGEDDSVSVIVLRSGGDRTFCAGASFEELVAISSPEQGKQFFMGFAKIINACRKCPKFIIGRVQGKAVGGGVGLIAATDYCLATRHAAVKLSELHIGLGPFVVGTAVERKVGLSAMSQLAINANAFHSAEWSERHGLYAQVHETTEALDQAVKELALYLAETNPEARTEMKRVFWEGYEHWDTLLAERAEISGRLVLSEFTAAKLNKYRKQPNGQ